MHLINHLIIYFNSISKYFLSLAACLFYVASLLHAYYYYCCWNFIHTQSTYYSYDMHKKGKVSSNRNYTRNAITNLIYRVYTCRSWPAYRNSRNYCRLDSEFFLCILKVWLTEQQATVSELLMVVLAYLLMIYGRISDFLMHLTLVLYCNEQFKTLRPMVDSISPNEILWRTMKLTNGDSLCEHLCKKLSMRL
jgi:hypothetical protein